MQAIEAWWQPGGASKVSDKAKSSTKRVPMLVDVNTRGARHISLSFIMPVVYFEHFSSLFVQFPRACVASWQVDMSIIRNSAFDPAFQPHPQILDQNLLASITDPTPLLPTMNYTASSSSYRGVTAERRSIPRSNFGISSVSMHFNIRSMLTAPAQPLVHSPTRLAGARQTLINEIRQTLDDPQIQDWNLITRYHEMQVNLEQRTQDANHGCQLLPGPVYQPVFRQMTKSEWPPAWRDLARPKSERKLLQRQRVRGARAEQSEAKRTLLTKLKACGQKDFEYLRKLKAAEAGIRDERFQLQTRCDQLNHQMTELEVDGEDLYVFEDTEPSMDDLIEQELKLRGGKPKRVKKTKKSRESGTQGMLTLLKDKTNRYSVDRRVLPWDAATTGKESLLKRVHTSLSSRALSLRKHKPRLPLLLAGKKRDSVVSSNGSSHSSISISSMPSTSKSACSTDSDSDISLGTFLLTPTTCHCRKQSTKQVPKVLRKSQSLHAGVKTTLVRRFRSI